MDSKDKIKIHKFDDLFPYIGGLGVYQFAHLFIMCKYVIFWLSLIDILRRYPEKIMTLPIGCDQYMRSTHTE